MSARRSPSRCLVTVSMSLAPSGLPPRQSIGPMALLARFWAYGLGHEHLPSTVSSCYIRPIVVPMGGERASTVRMRHAGKICAICSSPLPAPHTPGEQRCAKCGANHKVYMSFMLRKGWHCQFLEADLQTALPKKLSLTDQDRIFELAKRGGADINLETEQAIRHAISIGRGGVWLNLNDEQYRRLR